MARVLIKNINKFYPGNVHAVKNANLEIVDKEFCVLVGPSGCGKSTTLRMVAGLEEISSGDIYIDEHLVNGVPPKDRDIAMVFQNYALYPHMTVYGNMAFGLKLRGYSKKEIDIRVQEAADILGIEQLLDRRPKALSGGQRQRVAVGRAIVRKPKVFLFDEPLSNLDAKLRVLMRTEIKKLHERLQATMIYVTHDQIEAMTLGDKIVVMKDGIINQISDPLSLYTKPNNKFVSGFIGSPPMNFLNCALIQKEGTKKGEKIALYLENDSFSVKVPSSFLNDNVLSYVGKQVVFGIRPEDIYDKLYTADVPHENVVKAMVEVVEPMGNENFLYLLIGDQSIISRVEASNKAQANQDVEIVFNMQHMHLFDKETEESIV